MKSSLSLVSKKQTASFRVVGLMLMIVPLWLTLVATSKSAYGQTSDDASNSTAATSSPGYWTEFHRDNMQRWNPYETLLGVSNVADLLVKWKYGGLSGGSTSPAVVNGVVYVCSYDGVTYALNPNNGSLLWSYDTGVAASPAVANGVVYVGSSRDKALYALSASTGARLWAYTTAESIPGESSPTVANGTVYFGDESGTVYALNASTGAKLWSYSTGPGMVGGVYSSPGIYSSPAVVNGVVYVGSNDNNVYALNASTGVKFWSYNTGGRVLSSPAVANGVVYVGSEDNNVYALNASTGAKLWSYTTGDSVFFASPAVATEWFMSARRTTTCMR